MATNYRNHLYYENRTDSNEYKVMACYEVLGLIARLKDRRQNNIGNLQNIDKTIKRLEGYFNYRLKQIQYYENSERNTIC